MIAIGYCSATGFKLCMPFPMNFINVLNRLKKKCPTILSCNIALDQTKFIKKSISEVKETLMIALILVVLIIYLFFRDGSLPFAR